MDLTEKRLDGELVYDGGFLKVQRDRVQLPDGGSACREYIRHPGAVAVLALDGDCLIVVRQFRYPVGREFLEIPAGKIDAAESPHQTARRELQEETGYSASSWRYLGKAYPCIGYSDEVIHYYLATELQPGAARLDEGEFLEVQRLPLAQVQHMALSGALADGKTIVGLHWLMAWQQGMLTGETI